MKRAMRSNIASLAAITLAGAIAIAAYGAGDARFRQAFLPGAIATFLGVVAGLPVALWIDRQRTAVERAAAEAERKVRLGDFLNVVEIDLQRASDELERRIAGGSARTSDLLPFLQGNLWEAITASGEVALITEAAVLRALADAYYGVETTAYLERHVWELRTGVLRPDAMTMPLGVSPPRPRLDLAEQELRRQDTATLGAIGGALKLIDARR